MGEFLDEVALGRSGSDSAEALLRRGSYGELVEPQIRLHRRPFATRFELAESLVERLESGQAEDHADAGLWAWLALYFFDQLCPAQGKGGRRVGARVRWIPAVGNFRRYYRHLVAGPVGVFRAHRGNPEAARVLLCTPPHQPGEVVEQLTSRQELVRNPAVVGAATLLYFDSETGGVKRGAAGRGPGSARRLADVLNQLDVTWDLHAMTAEGVLAMLPSEFDRFRSL